MLNAEVSVSQTGACQAAYRTSAGLLVRRLGGVLGAEVEGLDLTRPMTAEQGAELRLLLNEHKVLVFRDQAITPRQQVDFAANFGKVHMPLVNPSIDTVPGITVIDSANAKGLTDEWHTDHTFTEVTPLAAMLHAVRIPSFGGDTLWADMCAAYDALSAPMREFLDGLAAQHDTVRMKRRIAEKNKKFDYLMGEDAVIHPVVRVHPETGRKALFVNPLYTARILGLREDESNALLAFLYQHIQSVEFQFRLTWRQHTTVIWDERSTIHYAMADYDEPRIMNRLMIEGTRPFGPRDRAAA